MKKRKNLKQSKWFALLIGGAVLVLCLVSYYLYTKSSFSPSSSEAVAFGTVLTVNLDEYKLTLRPVDITSPVWGIDDAKFPIYTNSQITWEYTVNGPIPNCFNTKTSVTESNSNPNISKLKFIMTRFVEKTACKDTGNVSPKSTNFAKGTFTAYNGEPFRFVISHVSRKVDSGKPVNLTLKGITLKSNDIVNYTIKGKTSDCYSRSVFYSTTAEGNTSEPLFMGTYGLRLFKRVGEENKTCADYNQKIDLSKKIDSNIAKGIKSNFVVRYVYQGSLIVDQVTTIPNTVIKNGITLTYNVDNTGVYSYTVKGFLPSPCYGVAVSPLVMNSGQKVVVEVKRLYDNKTICADVEKPFEKSGTFKANRNAIIDLSVVDVEMLPD